MTQIVPTESRSIPQSAVERFLASYEAFLKTVREALQAADPAHAETARWSKAQQTFERQFAELQSAKTAYAAGDSTALVKHASGLRMIARRMDGYAMDFAGPALEERLTEQRRLLVLVAWQIHAASTGSGSAGL